MFGTMNEFVDKFTAMFIHNDTKGEAIKWLTNTHVSKGLALNGYISQFQSKK